MNQFRDRYWGYENFKSMYYKTRKYTFNKVFEYDINKEHKIVNKIDMKLEGGKEIEKIIKKYSDIVNKIDIKLEGGKEIEEIIKKYSNIVNIQIDKISSKEIELMVVNINGQITCGIIILDKESNIATIHDLISDVSCLKRQTSKSVMEKIIEIIKKICKKLGMKYIVLTDDAYHTCRGRY